MTSATASDANVTRALTAGTNYCVVCQSQVTNDVVVLRMTTTAGNCGTLPVTVLEFEIGDDEE